MIKHIGSCAPQRSSFAMSTSAALNKASAASPSRKARRSTELVVTSAETSPAPVSISTSLTTGPRWTAMIVPRSWLRVFTATMLMIGRSRTSKRQLQPREHRLLVGPILAGSGPAVEARELVIGGEFEVAGQIPVQGHARAARVLGRFAEIGEIEVERLGIGSEGLQAGIHRKCAPALAAERERTARLDRCGVADVLAGEHVARAHEPGLMTELGMGTVEHDFLPRNGVFPEQTEGTVVVVKLRRQPPVTAVGQHGVVGRTVVDVLEEDLLARGAVTGQGIVDVAR